MAKECCAPGGGNSSFKRCWRERLIGFLKTNQWPLLAWLWGVSAVLGYWGFARYHADSPDPWYFWDKVYLTLQLYSVNSGNVTGIRSIGNCRLPDCSRRE